MTKTDKRPTKRKEQLRTTNNKKELIKAMIDSLGNISVACQMVGVSRETYFQYLYKDDRFRKRLDDITEMRLDFVENKLNKLIKAENPTAIIFFLKTKGRERGYIERQEIDARTDRLTGKHFSEAWQLVNKEPQKRIEK